MLNDLIDVQLQRNSYLSSYPSLIAFFHEHEINEEVVVQGAHMVYGWMPRSLEMKYERLKEVVDILNRVKYSKEISAKDLGLVFHTINRSNVGASKLLHFINPVNYPILDSVIYGYLQNRLKDELPGKTKPEFYQRYQATIRLLAGATKGKAIIKEVHKQLAQLGYSYTITPIRAIEAAMFVKWKAERELQGG